METRFVMYVARMCQINSGMMQDCESGEQDKVMELGIRVVRGPDWIWEELDGGEGHVGTVIKPFNQPDWPAVQSGTVFVQWDNGQIGNYRVGSDGAHDLRVLDSAPAGVKFRHTCNACARKHFRGMRFHCTLCDDYDLCQGCYMSDKHDRSHAFLRFDIPELSSKDGVLLQPRSSSTKIEAYGLYPGALVRRNVADWLQGSQDGGERGVLGSVIESDTAMPPTPGMVDVLWDMSNNGQVVSHNCGKDGRVEIHYESAASGGYYYQDHLLALDESNFSSSCIRGSRRSGEDEEDEDSSDRRIVSDSSTARTMLREADTVAGIIKAGDRVLVTADLNELKSLQDDQHGGWNNEMQLSLGAVGKVLGIHRTGGVLVKFRDLEKKWVFNPAALTKKAFYDGDEVKILESEEEFRNLQKKHGGWVKEMRTLLGKVCTVVEANRKDLLKVRLRERGARHKWHVNAACCRLVQEDDSGDLSDLDIIGDEVVGLKKLMDSLLESTHDILRPELLVEFAAHNKVAQVKAIVEKFPEQVNIQNQGKTALHMACLKGHLQCVKVLLDGGASVFAIDDDGNTPVHYAVYKKASKELLELLLKQGSCSDMVNFKCVSVLHGAVIAQHIEGVQLLLRHGCNVNVQDQGGDTPLHDAVVVNSREIVEDLANCPRTKFEIRNYRGFNTLDHAALKGNCFAVEKIIQKAPGLVNMCKADGVTPLHIACINGYKDVAEALVTFGRADLERRDNANLTPLLHAVMNAKGSVAELLVSLGANVNCSDNDGNTCLHMILKFVSNVMSGKLDRRIPLEGVYATEEISQISSSLPKDLKEANWIALACYLVKHGADLGVENMAGNPAISMMEDPAVVEIILCQTSRECEKLETNKLIDTSSVSKQTPTECLICSELPAVIILKPCNHIVGCHLCSKLLKKCPLQDCRTVIEDRLIKK